MLEPEEPVFLSRKVTHMPRPPGPRKTRRKHRRVRTDWKGCGCPDGAKKVITCSVTPAGEKKCRGRGWGCIGTRVSKKGKKSKGFVAAVCPPMKSFDA